MSLERFKPLKSRILVQVDTADSVSDGGIIIPDTAKEKPHKGKVIAAGPGTKKDPMTVKKGDVILYGKHAGTAIEIDKEPYLIMNESDIFAIL